MSSEILKPVVILAAWTMIMWLWMYVTRIPAINKSSIDANSWVGGTAKDLDEALPPRVQWVAHNYNHLHEAPTVFYALALVLAFLGSGDTLNAQIAWAYVGLRIAHSLVQVLSNRIIVRFALFFLSSLCLIALTLHAVVIVFSR